ncbi:hypothetical protein Y032_0359g3426 [Ancylostoma ceylanicum]|uniref:Uncharacterized protein n=1 Tax=Ancylostoma ceylanicum TaxID=53326 RepID=A0A016RVQ9_9BILA|nr:hypothetical protein Y032_0359g3426 [Ancylostoma ceylanicum]
MVMEGAALLEDYSSSGGDAISFTTSSTDGVQVVPCVIRKKPRFAPKILKKKSTLNKISSEPNLKHVTFEIHVDLNYYVVRKNGEIGSAWDHVHDRSFTAPICAKARVCQVAARAKSAWPERVKKRCEVNAQTSPLLINFRAVQVEQLLAREGNVQDRNVARERLVVSLGGNSPKGKAVNYKLLKEQRKQQKADDAKKATGLKSMLQVNMKKKKKK